MRHAPEDRAAMVAAILAAYHGASDTERAAGADWYPAAGTIIAAIADWSGMSCQTVAAVTAALSPRNPWRWNVQDAAAYAWAATHGQTMPRASTFGSNERRAWAIATGGADWRGSAPKVRSFVANMTGDPNAVTVDVWAIRVATRGRRSTVRNDADYQNVADAYRDAAAILGEPPRDVQATTWIGGQTAGLGSARRGRHDRAIKRGTLHLVRELLTGQLGMNLL